MGQEQILDMLMKAQGSYLSGEAMSQKLGVSRAAVWKTMTKLKQAGYEIDSVPHKGYALCSLPNRLDKTGIAQGLEPGVLAFQIHCHDSVGSTNTQMKQLALQGAEEGLVLTAEEQTAGRGRRGRSFHSPKGAGLYFSLLLRPGCGMAELQTLTPWVAVAVAEGIEACCGVKVDIKWTNDLVVQGKKVCGILTELMMESQGDFVDCVVVGIGINVNHKQSDFPAELQDMMWSLCQETGEDICRNALCQAILSAINRMYALFPQENTHYLKIYREKCVTLGREVQVLIGEELRQAQALEIDQAFRLKVRYTNGEEVFLSSGEVSLRGMYGYI